MDRQQIRDRQVMERYLQGSLTAEEEQAFEEAYVADPALLEELQLVERLQQGIKSWHAGGAVSGGAGRWRKALASPQYAAAASLLLVVTLGFSIALYRENLDLRAFGPPPGAAAPRLVALMTMRGAAVTAVEEPEANEWTVLLLDPGLARYERYRAVLRRAGRDGAEVVWMVEGLEPGYESLLAAGLPARVLQPGNYEVELAGRNSDWPADRFEAITLTPLQVTPRD